MADVDDDFVRAGPPQYMRIVCQVCLFKSIIDLLDVTRCFTMSWRRKAVRPETSALCGTGEPWPHPNISLNFK